MFSSRSAILGSSSETLPNTRFVLQVNWTVSSGQYPIIGLADANVANGLFVQPSSVINFPTGAYPSLYGFGAYGNNVLAVGYDGGQVPAFASIYVSTDGGELFTRSAAPSPIAPNEVLTGTVGPNLFVLGTQFSNGNTYSVFTSSDGVNWTQRNSNTSARLRTLTYTNNTYFYTTTSSVIGKSSDGITWTSDNSTPLPFAYTISSGASNVILIGGYTGGVGNNIVRSTDNGNTFTGYNIANGRSIMSLAYDPSGATWVGVTDTSPSPAKIIRSTDGGVTWTEYTLPVEDANAFNHIFYSSDNYFVVVGNNGSVAKSTDGITWTTVPVNWNSISIPGQNGVIKFTV